MRVRTRVAMGGLLLLVSCHRDQPPTFSTAVLPGVVTTSHGLVATERAGVSAVRGDNQRALGETRRLPFAKFVVGMHHRMHPLFSDGYLDSLDSAPPHDPRNRKDLVTRLEIHVAASGELDRVLVVQSSGVRDFDAAALDAVTRAAPFDEPPRELLSWNKKVYLHWEFHRNQVVGCSPINSRPFILAQ